MATEVSAKLGLIITAKDEASQIFKEFATKVMESMKVVSETVKPVQEAMKVTAESFTATSETVSGSTKAMQDGMKATSEAAIASSEAITGTQKTEREEIYLTRDALLEWSRANSEAFKGAGAAANGFADMSTSDMKRVYQATTEMRVGVVSNLTAIKNETDGPLVASVNKWRETVVMSSKEIQTALQGIIEKDSTLSGLTRLLGEENSSTWKGMYEQITGVNVALARTVTAESEVSRAAITAAESFGSMSKAASLQMVGSTIEGVGRKVTGFFVESIKAGADFEHSVSSITATLNERLTPATQLTTKEVEDLSNKALELGKVGLFSANDLADAMYVMSKQGVNYSNIMGGAIKTVQDVAGATDSSLIDTANVMTDILNEYGPSVKQFGATTEEQFSKVGDMISGAMHNARMTMSEFLDTLKYVGPLAGGLGLPLTDVSTALSLLAKAGIKGTQSGTMLRAMLADLPGRTGPAIDKMKELGIITKDGGNKFFDASGKVKSLADMHDILQESMGKLSPMQTEVAMKTMFGMRSLGGMEAILHTTDEELVTLTGDVNKTGSAHELMAAKMDNAAGRMQVLKSNFETMQKTIGIALLPVVEKLVVEGQKMIDWFSGLSEPMQTFVVSAGALTGVTLLLSGAFMNTVAMFKFFHIALGDLLTRTPAATVATTELTVATSASGVASEGAAIAREELNVATGATVLANGEAILATDGLAGATGVLAVATEGATVAVGGAEVAASGLALGFLPIVGIIAGVGVALFELYQHFQPFQDFINETANTMADLGGKIKTFFWGSDYTNDITKMSNESVASVVTMSNRVLTQLEELDIKGGAISKDTAANVIAASKDMHDKVITTAKSRYTEEIASANKLFKDSKVIDEATYNSMVDTANRQKLGVTAEADAMNKNVSDKVAEMSKAGIKVTDDMKEQLIRDFQAMTKGAVLELSEGEIQQKAILAILESDHGEVTAKIASDTLKNAAAARNGATDQENKKYQDIVATVIRNRDVLHTMTNQQASDAIDSATKQHTGVLSQITGTYNDTMFALQNERPGLVNEVNLTTGAMLTGWQRFGINMSSFFSNLAANSSSWVANLNANINKALGYKETIDYSGSANTGKATGAQRNAQGTDFFSNSNGESWVGEDGPELIKVPNGSKITPHQSSMNRMVNMGGGSGGGGNKTQNNTYTINVNGVGKNGAQIGQDIAKQLRLQMAMVN